MALDFTLEALPVKSDQKNDRFGRAAILKPEQLGELFGELRTERDRFLFGICYFTASRITETLRLERSTLWERRSPFASRTQRPRPRARRRCIRRW